MPEGRRTTLIALACFLGGCALSGAVFFFAYSQSAAQSARPLRESDISTYNDSEYKFTDPLLGISDVQSSSNYDDVEQELESFIQQQKSAGLVSASIDFRDIRKPGGFVIDPAELYHAASLYKVPLMMAYYKIAEGGQPAIFSQEIYYSGATNLDNAEEIKSPVQLAPGTYTVEQLIEHMIRYSDNNAADLLLQHLKDTNNYQNYTSVYSDLGIDPATVDEQADNVSVQDYSLFLRTLYNATYLDRTDSERALELMTQTDFTEGIESGVPNSIPVAEKFGETQVADASGNLIGKELNNCGIVYYPNHSYLLCIMTKGTGDNVPFLEDTLRSISHMVYQSMEKMYPQGT